MKARFSKNSIILSPVLLVFVLNASLINALTWSIETVDGFDDEGKVDVGEWTSLAVDTADRPHISYFDDTHWDLKYAHWTGSSWAIQTVDSTGNIGRYTSIALDSGGNPHITYYGETLVPYKLKYAQ